MWQVVLVVILIWFSILFIYMGSHLLNSLILLESMVLVIYLMMVLLMSSTSSGIGQVMILFVLTVSSSSVGLSILVSLARSHGTDLFKSYNLIW